MIYFIFVLLICSIIFFSELEYFIMCSGLSGDPPKSRLLLATTLFIVICLTLSTMLLKGIYS